MIGSLPKLISLLMALLLVGSTFVGGIIYFIRSKYVHKYRLPTNRRQIMLNLSGGTTQN